MGVAVGVGVAVGIAVGVAVAVRPPPAAAPDALAPASNLRKYSSIFSAPDFVLCSVRLVSLGEANPPSELVAADDDDIG